MTVTGSLRGDAGPSLKQAAATSACAEPACFAEQLRRRPTAQAPAARAPVPLQGRGRHTTGVADAGAHRRVDGPAI
jgi:hypothetical protein